MAQKYKFFVTSKVLEIKNNADFSVGQNSTDERPSYSACMAEACSIFNKNELTENRVLYVSNAEKFVNELLEKYTIVVAAGGYVINARNELLMIYRRGFWDLPKGKVEPGESLSEAAIREVEEECGVSGLVINSDHFDTYHLYIEKKKVIVKRSAWYKMSTDYDSDLLPQIEEGISEVKWMNKPIPKEILRKSYPSIVEVIQRYS